MPALSKRDIITYFTGVRAPTFEEDFILEPGRRTRNLIHVAGIQSPGLTTAPAVAVDMAELAVDMLGKTETVEKNNNYNPIRKGVPVLREMDDDTREKNDSRKSRLRRDYLPLRANQQGRNSRRFEIPDMCSDG